MSAKKLVTAALIGIALAGCSNQTTPASNTSPESTASAPAPEPTPEKAKQYVVMSASMRNRQYTEAHINPATYKPGDHYYNDQHKNEYLSEGRHTGESHTRYEVTVTYTLRGQDGVAHTRTVPRDKVKVVAEDTDYAYAYATDSQLASGEITIIAPKDYVTEDGKVNLNTVAE